MPRRTNKKQAIIYFVRQHYASSNASVYESKYLTDAVTGGQREVDVVIEETVSGDPVIISVEVLAHSRRAGTPWVEQQLAKHEHLPTNVLILVSWSGFTKPALAKAATLQGRVHAVQPAYVERDGQTVVHKLYIDQVNLAPERVAAFVSCSDGKFQWDDIPIWVPVTFPGSEPMTLLSLATQLLKPKEVGQRVLLEAHGHDDRDALSHFVVGIGPEGDFKDLGLVVTHPETSAPCNVDGLRITGRFSFVQSELRLDVMHLRDLTFATGTASFLGQSTVWVATSDPVQGTTTLSWRAVDDS